MGPFSQKYLQLPVEEKVEHEALDTPTQRSRWSNKVTVLVASMLLIISLLVLGLATSKVTEAETKLVIEPVTEADHSEWVAAEMGSRATGDEYLLGVGKADITGPVVELNFMGYASLSQIGTGLRQRLYSRTFIVGSTTTAADRWVYLVLDTANGDTAVRNGILEGVAALGSAYSMYNDTNIAVTGTHSHSGPGGWLNYLLPQVTNLGFDQQSYQAIVTGAVLSIQRAHESLAPGTLAVGETDVLDANINRSGYSYLANPAEERAEYEYDVDKTITMLRFQRASDGLNLGFVAWHAVHGTSMLENNTHVSGDNKGVASYLFEQSQASVNPDFVAAFSQANVGDTTPNVLGAWCDDGSGEMCTFENSTCAGASENCHGRGPLFQALDLGVSSCYEIGRRVYQASLSLYDSFDTVSTPITDPSVKGYHTFQDMAFFNFTLPNGTIAETCPAALGYGFAGGTTDGPGISDFYQNDPASNSQNPFWALVSGFLSTPTPAQAACQLPKPVLLNVGQMTFPYAWSPNIVDVQSFRVGQFIIIVSPSEATTMAGRRWRNAVSAAAVSQEITKSTPIVVLGGPANTYAHYCTTAEEYAVQRYEGGSTLYGQNELNAYIHLSEKYLRYLAANSTSKPALGPLPPDNRNSSIDLIEGVVYDTAPIGTSFGQCTVQPSATYTAGAVINATFIGANPRNNLRLEGTFTAVELLQSGVWTQVRDDKDWSLEYTWTNTNGLLGNSEVVISWETAAEEAAVSPGTYRIRYNGDNKVPITGTINSFTGTSNNFTIT